MFGKTAVKTRVSLASEPLIKNRCVKRQIMKSNGNASNGVLNSLALGSRKPNDA